MTETAVRRRTPWLAARVFAVRSETPVARTIVLDVPGWPGHDAGQHVDVKLTAPDGYSAQRSYSIAAPPSGDRIELAVHLVPDGEVSPYLVDELLPTDELEVRGPIGGWFTWHATETLPVVLIAGGSGIVPLMAMIRERTRTGSTAPFTLVYSTRGPSDVFYEAELAACDVPVRLLYTRADTPNPPGGEDLGGRPARLDGRAGVRLRPDRFRGGGGGSVAGPRSGSGEHPHGTFRPNRRMRCTSTATARPACSPRHWAWTSRRRW